MNPSALRPLLSGLTVILLVAVARSASACAVCLSATDETREAYYGSTVLMMLLPFLLVGGLAYWVRRVAGSRRSLPGSADSSTP